MNRPARPPGKPPDAARLREAALLHLSRFAATEAGLARVLARRIDRWARAAEAAGAEPETTTAAARAARAAIPGVLDAMRELGAVNDAEFAAARARRLTGSGRSRRATLAHLAAKGVAPDLAAELLPEDPERDLAAACAYLRRRRLPPFTAGDRTRALATLARAGFTRATAESALALTPESAESLLLSLRHNHA